MVRAILTVIAVSGVLSLGMSPTAQAKVDVHIGIGIPPPPAVVFESEPQLVVVPGTQVFYLANPDYDLYRYGGYYYVNRDGYWYRSRSYRGPFGYVEYGRVPRQIVVVPGNFHHYPVHPSNWHPGPSHHDAPAHHGSPPAHHPPAHHPPPQHEHAPPEHEHGPHD
jgi:hypothetical protein